MSKFPISTAGTFTKKLNDLNDRNPENTLQYIPTADPWTWTPSVKPTPTPLMVSRPASSRDRSQPPNKTTAPPRRVDSYVPKYDSYVPKYDKSGKRMTTENRDWSQDDHAPVIPRELMDARPLDREYLAAVNNEHASGSTLQVPALTITPSEK
jgi:hypothetical protein